MYSQARADYIAGMTNIGFSGTQLGMTERQLASLRRLVSGVEGVTWHHGDCVGADFQFHVLLRQLDYRIVSHPPVNESKRAWTLPDEERLPREYLARNRDIVDESSVMIFAPGGFVEAVRSGTWSTYRYCVRRGKPWIIVFPDGSRKKSPPEHLRVSCQLTNCSICGRGRSDEGGEDDDATERDREPA